MFNNEVSSGRPHVTAVTVFYNRSKYVPDSVESLIQQDYPNLEILLVDDGSTDGTLAALQRYAHDPRVRILTQGNRGFTIALKDAIEQSSGEFIAFHDAGDVSYPTRITRQVEALMGHPKAVLCSSFVDNEDSYTGKVTIHKPRIDSTLIETLLRDNPFYHGEMMYRRDAYEKVGGYRRFFRFSQDYDLWLRMSLLGEAVIVPEVLYHRPLIPGSISMDPKKILLQALLAEFARQCLLARRSEGMDMLDRHGPAGVLLRQRSPRIANKLAGKGTMLMVKGQQEFGATFLRAARQECVTPRTWLLSHLIWLERIPFLWEHSIAPILHHTYLRRSRREGA